MHHTASVLLHISLPHSPYILPLCRTCYVLHGRVNYSGTQKLLDLASKMQQLQSFVHVSTFYVNNFKPYNSEVKEEVHVLPLHRPGERYSLQ